MENQASILVIDDEQIILDSCHRILAGEDYNVDTNTNPTEGLENALTKNYDLVLLDLSMQEMDGMHLLYKLRMKKPDIPVMIITGYPTKESKDLSHDMGVSHYILKPFTPDEILGPVKKIIQQARPSEKETIIEPEKLQTIQLDWKGIGQCYRFYKSGWMLEGLDGNIRVGGQLPVFLNENIMSITLPAVNDIVYRGLPLAEINFSDNTKFIIPCSVTGKVTGINTELKNNPSLFESGNNAQSWIATILPDNFEEDLTACELRKVIFFSRDKKACPERSEWDENKYVVQLTNLGYIVDCVSSIDETIKLISEANAQAIILDADLFSDTGPKYAETIKKEFSNIKIVVFAQSNSNLEPLYREKNIFYYATHPITSKEISCILYSAFCFSKDKLVTESHQATFLPQTISRIQITNKHSKKVVLLAFDNILQYNKGIGYLIAKNLLAKAYPIELDQTTRHKNSFKDSNSLQKISKEKQKNEKVIVLYEDNLYKIPGSIVKQKENYENTNSSDNLLIKITVQSDLKNSDENIFDLNTTIALAELIVEEMASG